MVSEWVIELHNEFYDVIILKKKKSFSHHFVVYLLHVYRLIAV